MCFLKIRRQTIDSVFSKMAVAAILELGEMANFLVYCPILVFQKNKTNRTNNPKLISVIRITPKRLFEVYFGEQMKKDKLKHRFCFCLKK